MAGRITRIGDVLVIALVYKPSHSLILDDITVPLVAAALTSHELELQNKQSRASLNL
jgi:hypothetical protein